MIAHTIVLGCRNTQFQVPGSAITRALNAKDSLRRAGGVLTGGGFHDAHEMIFEFIELGTKKFNSARRASGGSFTAMPQCENIGRSETKQKFGDGGIA